MTIKLVVSGCRDFMNEEFIEAKLVEWIEELGPVEIVHGGCHGTDTVVNNIAARLGIPCTPFKASFRHGKIGGPARNYVMVREADALLAFWRPGCKGTTDAIRQASNQPPERGVRVKTVNIEGIPNFTDPF
jgi:hypothetical protein